MPRDENELSDAQRIAVLEEQLGKHQRMLLVILILAIVSTVVVLTLGVVRMVRPPSSYATTQVQEQVLAKITQIQTSQSAMQERQDRLQLDLDSSQAAVFKAMFLEQEKSYQQHLTTLKQGMRDLARMIPGSRTWLEIYEEQMDSVIAQSAARMAKLAQVPVHKGAPPIEAIPLPESSEPVKVEAP